MRQDADGNPLGAPLLTASSGSTPTLAPLTWDARNRLISAGGITYGYDRENRRTQSTSSAATAAQSTRTPNPPGTTRYVYARGSKLDRLLAKTNPDGSITRYIYGRGPLYELIPLPDDFRFNQRLLAPLRGEGLL